MLVFRMISVCAASADLAQKLYLVLSGVNDGGILSLTISTGELDEDESVRFLRVKKLSILILFH